MGKGVLWKFLNKNEQKIEQDKKMQKPKREKAEEE